MYYSTMTAAFLRMPPLTLFRLVKSGILMEDKFDMYWLSACTKIGELKQQNAGVTYI